jgi:hypothetical protein
MFIKKLIKKIRLLLNGKEDIVSYLDRVLILNGMHASQRNAHQKLSNINDAEFQIYSQWGEDGIIDYLIGRIEKKRFIPNKFIELGVENYIESNTRFLLKNRNWSGLVIDGSEENIKFIKEDSIYWRHDLQAKAQFITAENIDKLIADSGFLGDVGLLSIDIDGNDYYIWDAVKCANPVIVVCEYNSLFGDQYEITIPYKRDFLRSNEHFSNLYFGASIRALISKGIEKGYFFIGSSSNGVNAFFIRNDYFDIFENDIDEIAMFPSKFSESRDASGQLSFLRAESRIEQIKNMQIFKVDSSCTMTICDLSNIYSHEWSHGYKSKYVKKIDGDYYE